MDPRERDKDRHKEFSALHPHEKLFKDLKKQVPAWESKKDIGILAAEYGLESKLSNLSTKISDLQNKIKQFENPYLGVETIHFLEKKENLDPQKYSGSFVMQPISEHQAKLCYVDSNANVSDFQILDSKSVKLIQTIRAEQPDSYKNKSMQLTAEQLFELTLGTQFSANPERLMNFLKQDRDYQKYLLEGHPMRDSSDEEEKRNLLLESYCDYLQSIGNQINQAYNNFVDNDLKSAMEQDLQQIEKIIDRIYEQKNPKMINLRHTGIQATIDTKQADEAKTPGVNTFSLMTTLATSKTKTKGLAEGIFTVNSNYESNKKIINTLRESLQKGIPNPTECKELILKLKDVKKQIESLNDERIGIAVTTKDVIIKARKTPSPPPPTPASSVPASSKSPNQSEPPSPLSHRSMSPSGSEDSFGSANSASSSSTSSSQRKVR